MQLERNSFTFDGYNLLVSTVEQNLPPGYSGHPSCGGSQDSKPTTDRLFGSPPSASLPSFPIMQMRANKLCSLIPSIQSMWVIATILYTATAGIYSAGNRELLVWWLNYAILWCAYLERNFHLGVKSSISPVVCGLYLCSIP